METYIALAGNLRTTDDQLCTKDDGLACIFSKHIHYENIPTLYPEARIMKEVLPEEAVTLCRQTFAGETLTDSTPFLFQCKEYRACWRAQRVAQEGGIVLMPKQCGDAALVAAYAMEKCSQSFLRHNWYSSILSSAEQSHKYWYPRVDWAFWVMYGSWSVCGGAADCSGTCSGR